MSELQAYYNAFRTGYWAHPDPKVCRCHGSGWANSEVDTWHECPIHYRAGQPHPEDPPEEWDAWEARGRTPRVVEKAPQPEAAPAEGDDLLF